MSESYSVCELWPHEVPVAFAAGTPTASSAAGVMKRSMHWPPTLLRTRPIGTCLNAGTFCLRCSAVKKHVALKESSAFSEGELEFVFAGCHLPAAPWFMTLISGSSSAAANASSCSYAHDVGMSMLLCPEHKNVCPKSTSSITTPCVDELKESVKGVSDARTAIVVLQFPDGGTTKGFGEIAPAGAPEMVMDSPGTPTPHTRAGVEPPDHSSDDASTMCALKTRESGPQGAGAAGGGTAAKRTRSSAARSAAATTATIARILNITGRVAVPRRTPGITLAAASPHPGARTTASGTNVNVCVQNHVK